ncbi:MAG: DUF1801 domain-containing protein [Candidatus Limnocylindrales bacterium]
MLDPFPPDAFLDTYPAGIRDSAEVLRALIKRVVPGVVERVRLGWRLIGYDLPVGRRLVYFAWVAPEPIHVHIGFQVGTLMADPERLLEGAHLKLKKVRFVTFQPGTPIPEPSIERLTREAVRIAALPRQSRLAMALDRDWAPGHQRVTNRD